MEGIWKFVVLAAFVATMVGVILALHAKLHALNVEHEAGELAKDLSSTIQRAGNSKTQLSITYPLREGLGGYAYEVRIEGGSVTVAVPNLNISQQASHGNLSVSSGGPFRGGDVLTIVGAGGEVTVSGG